MLRTASVLLLVTTGLASGACGVDKTPGGPAGADVSDLTSRKLDVLGADALPIEEVSGLGTRTQGGKPSYLAIGDGAFSVVTFDIEASGAPTRIEKHDLSELFGGGASQWEAVAGDSTGSVFLLDETASTITVLDPALAKITHTMSLTIPPGHPLASAWQKDENSRGEGMILMANGHVLLAKEKGPAALIELAPAGEAASGYTPELALGGKAFPLPTGTSSTFVPVAYWELKSDAAKVVADISDLATDATGQLYVLSDQSRVIARIERELISDEGKIDLKAVYELPKAVDKPEGLLLVGGAPLVTVDQPSLGAKTLFRLDSL